MIKEQIAGLPFYTEGPAIDDQGNFYCTTLTGGSILKINRRNQVSEWARSACPNGQVILPGGDHLVCDSKLSVVVRFDADGQFLKNELALFCADEPISVPNDLITDSQGNLYFTDSVRNNGKIFFLGTNGEQKVVTAGLDYPNGLVLAHDERCLYVAESYQNRILQIDLKAPGEEAGSFSVFAALPRHHSGQLHLNLPDGLALAKNGELFVAHYGMQMVQVLSATGQLLTSIESGMPLTSNLCFLDDNSIMVTGGTGEPGPGGVFKIQL